LIARITEYAKITKDIVSCNFRTWYYANV